MPTISELKEQEATDTPIALFEIELVNGGTLRVCTHPLTHEGESYLARVIRSEPFELKVGGDGSDSNGKLTLTLANSDSYFAGIDPAMGWKGAKLIVRFCFYNLASGIATSETIVAFRGICAGMEEVNEEAIRLVFHNRLGMQRVWLPSIRLQKLCPWMFPSTAAQREEAVAGGESGPYSGFYRCGYSADIPGGVGDLNGGAAFDRCGYTRSDCAARGMLTEDSAGRPTKRFGGFPMLSEDAVAEGNVVAPLIYGTGWCDAPVVNVRREGTLVKAEALVSFGPIQGVLKVLVNGYELRESETVGGADASGSYSVASLGSRNGVVHQELQVEGSSSSGPYGSFAYVVIHAPANVIPSNGRVRVRVLAQGLQLPSYGLSGEELAPFYTNNPIWVLLDVVRRAGWRPDEIDLVSFAKAAARCDELVMAKDREGNDVAVPRHRCNLVLQAKRSLSEIVRGLRASVGLGLTYDENGRLRVVVEDRISDQQSEAPPGSNAQTTVAGGWPVYEFGDGSEGRSGIARTGAGASSLRLWTKTSADAPNRLSLVYDDEFNEYQRDTLSLVDVSDAERTGQEINGSVNALGVPNRNQALRTLARHLRRSVEGNLFVEFETSVKGIRVAPGSLFTLTYSREALDRELFRVLTVSYSTNFTKIRIVGQKHVDAWYSSGSDPLYGEGSSGSSSALPRPVLGNLVEGESGRIGVTESVVLTGDERVLVVASAGFAVPGGDGLAALPTPRLLPIAEAVSAGGSMAGGRIWYYAITGRDAEGRESPLSNTTRVALPTGNGYAVRLSGVWAGDAASLNIYRGADPQRLQRIAGDVGVSDEYVDSGVSLGAVMAPPDPNFDHANAYWRLELQPAVAASGWSANTITAASLSMPVNEYAGRVVRLTAGVGAGQERMIRSNTANTLSVGQPWTVMPSSTTQFVVAESTWTFGGAGKSSPLDFEAPNRPGAHLHVTVRAANAQGVESNPALAPVTRWQILGDAGSSIDLAPPPLPSFGLGLAGRGTVELSGVGFQTLSNTRGIASGTLVLHYWSETGAASAFSLAGPVGTADSALTLNAIGPAQTGDLIQIGGEVLQVSGGSGATYNVVRGTFGSPAQSHSAGDKVLHLKRRADVCAFPREFFGSPASGSYAHVVSLPNVRVAGAEFFVTNSKGNSPVRQLAFSTTPDGGLRTLSSGQYSIQIEGVLAMQTSATPPITVEEAHAVRDILARVKEAPTGGPVQLTVRQNGSAYCDLTIAAGSTVSNVVNGLVAGPLLSHAALTLDVTSVPIGGNDHPGRDLTVTIRL